MPTECIWNCTSTVMENSKKIILCLFLLSSILFCKNSEQESIKKEITSEIYENSAAEDSLIYIGNSLFKNGNILCLKVKNARLMHPSQLNKQHQDSICLERVFSKEENKEVELMEVVDTSSFIVMNNSGTFFMDSGMIYMYSRVPHPNQFVAFKRNDEKFLGEQHNWLVLNGVIYYQGKSVDGINVKAVSIRRYEKTDKSGYIELLTDGKSIYFNEYPLDRERLSFIEELSEEDKVGVINEFKF